jgi:hypothetical protein
MRTPPADRGSKIIKISNWVTARVGFVLLVALIFIIGSTFFGRISCAVHTIVAPAIVEAEVVK